MITLHMTEADAEYLLRTLVVQIGDVVQAANNDLFRKYVKDAVGTLFPDPGLLTVARLARAEQLHRVYMAVGERLCESLGHVFVPEEWSYIKAQTRKEE